MRRALEVLVVLIALASLWPRLLGWPHPFWDVLMYVMLAVMAALFVANVARLWRMGHRSPPDDEPH